MIDASSPAAAAKSQVSPSTTTSSSKRIRYSCPYCRERYFTAEFRDTHVNSWCPKRFPSNESKGYEKVIKNLNEILQQQENEGRKEVNGEKEMKDMNNKGKDEEELKESNNNHENNKEKKKYCCQFCSEEFFSIRYRDRHQKTCPQQPQEQQEREQNPNQTPTSKIKKSTTGLPTTPNTNELKDIAISLTKQLLSVHRTPKKTTTAEQQQQLQLLPMEEKQDTNRYYTCPYTSSCYNKQFKTENALKNHLKDSHKSEFHSYLDPSLMNIHPPLPPSPPPPSLPPSPTQQKSLSTVTPLIPSPIDSHNSIIYRCNLPNCTVSFRSKSNFFNHLRLTHKLSDVTEDMIPQYTLSSTTNITTHSQPLHPSTPSKISSTSSFPSSPPTQHLPYYTIIFKCNATNCHKQFQSKSSLQSHLRDSHQIILPRNWISEPISMTTTTTTTATPTPGTPLSSRKKEQYRCLWCDLYFINNKQRENHCKICLLKPSSDIILQLLLATLDGMIGGGTSSIDNTPQKSLEGTSGSASATTSRSMDPSTLSAEDFEEKMKLKEKRKSLRKSITPADEALLRLSRSSTFPNSSSTTSSTMVSVQQPPPLPLSSSITTSTSSSITTLPAVMISDNNHHTLINPTKTLSSIFYQNPHDTEISDEGSDAAHDDNSSVDWDEDFSDDNELSLTHQLQPLQYNHHPTATTTTATSTTTNIQSLTLKEIHHNALMEAYLSLADIIISPPYDTAIGENSSQEQEEIPLTSSSSHPTTTPTTIDNSLLSFNKFIQWDQISNVISQGGLTYDLIQQTFYDLLGEGEGEGEDGHENPTHQLKNQLGICFNEFCILMERLEYASTGEEEILKDISFLSNIKEEEEEEEENHDITSTSIDTGHEHEKKNHHVEGDAGDRDSPAVATTSAVNGDDDDDNEEEEEGEGEGEDGFKDIIKRRKQSILLVEL